MAVLLLGNVKMMNFTFLSDTPGSSSVGSISPEFLTETDRVLASKAATLDDPYNPAINVPWLKLASVEGQGTYAKSIFRINTFQGQPPSSASI